MRVSRLITFVAVLSLVPAMSISATEELPDDEFLEFLGAWDEVWNEVCDPEGELAGDDACIENDDEQDKEKADDEA